MAIPALIQGPFGISEGDASVTRSWVDSTPIEGNLLVAVGRGTNAATNASISGWTQAVSALYGATGEVVIFYKIAGAGEGDVTLDWTGSTGTTLAIEEWSNIDPVPLDQTAKTDNTGCGTSRSSGTTPATTVADEVLIVGFAMGAAISTGSESYSNSFVDDLDVAATHFCFIASKVVSATGAQECTISWTTTRVAGGVIATFKAKGDLVTVTWHPFQSESGQPEFEVVPSGFGPPDVPG